MKFRHVLISVALLLSGVLVWGILAPSLHVATDSAYQIQCASNLKNLSTFGMLYADKADGYFPHSPNGSIATLQQLAEAFPDDFRPEVFICRDGEETPPAVVDGRLTLTPESCSYEAAPWRLSLSDTNAILYYDKKPHHQWRRETLRNVVFTDGKVVGIEEDMFQKRIEEERARFSVREKQTTEEETGQKSENPPG